jgi:hypothetical protein
LKSSERILALCAVVLTVVALLAWLRFDSAESHTTRDLPSVLTMVHTNQIRRVKSQHSPLQGRRIEFFSNSCQSEPARNDNFSGKPGAFRGYHNQFRCVCPVRPWALIRTLWLPMSNVSRSFPVSDRLPFGNQMIRIRRLLKREKTQKRDLQGQQLNAGWDQTYWLRLLEI